jgi:hypothetical protein
LSGGKLSEFGGLGAAKEFRVWCHPHSGEDVYFKWKTLAGAQSGRRKLVKSKRYYKVETPLAVVWDKKYRKHREVVIDKASLR